MKKKRVLFLLEAFDKGGIEKVTLDIVNNLNPERYDITVQTFWYGGYCQSQVNDNVRVIPFFFKRYVRGIIRLINYLSPRLLYILFVHGNYDVEIAASDGGAAKVISGSTNRNAKKICWVHMDVMARGSQLKEFSNNNTAKNIYTKFDLIVPVSETCKENFVKKFGDAYNIKVCRNPMTINDIRMKSQIKSDKSKFGSEKIHFVCIGRLVEQKGFDRLIEVCARLKKEGYIFFKVHILGDGLEKAKLSKLIKENNLESNVLLYGFIENPYPFIKNADVFLLTSRDEAFPLVVGESLIVGTPVIATLCCGVSEWLQDGKYGMIVENSTEGIYMGMKKVLEQPELLDDYRITISEFAERMFLDNELTKFEELL